MAEGEGRWSIWYNRDRPWIGDGDVETVELIEQNFGPICPRGQKIVSSVCRLTMLMEEFTQSTSGQLDDHLQIPCTTKGLLCLNEHQQGTNGLCNDYAIKFLCQDSTDIDDNDEGSPFPQFDVRIYIILAVVPILIFLIRILWAFVFRRRRQQRRAAGRSRRHRGRRDRDTFDDDNSSIASSLANPPPSYKELFGVTGPNRSSVFAISSRNIPICEHCKEASCSVVTALQPPLHNSQDAESSAVPRSTSNSTTLTSVTSRLGSISSNLDNAETLTPSTSSSIHSPHPSHNTDNDDSNTQNFNSARVHVDIEQHDINESITRQNIAVTSDSDSTSPNVFPSTSYVSIENETNHRPGNKNDNNSDSEAADNASTHGLSNIVQLNHQQEQQQQQQQQQHPPQPIFAPLSTRNGPSPPEPSHKNMISDPCACTCHRTVPYKGREVGIGGYDNPGFHHESARHSSGALESSRIPPEARIHRVWSNLSTGSTLTLSELPSYQDALELIKKKEAEAMQSSN